MASRVRDGLSRVAAKVKIGMRAEDPARIWERRAPLTPETVYSLTSSGRAQVEVVSCARRVYKDHEYQRAGATIVPSLGPSNIVIGIKEPPLAEVDPHASGTTHFMFSHTAKGQPYNTPLLAKFVDPPHPRPRLIDYELLTDENGKRTVGFGFYAGVAGVLESLSSMAHSHLEIGVASPFLYTPRPHTLRTLKELRQALREIGTAIETNGTPPQLGPFIFGLTGTGKVAEGCLSMLSELPIVSISVEDLPNIVKVESHDALKKIYLVHAKPKDYLVRLDGGQYDRSHYYASPHSYTSVFAEKVAPYLTLFLNGTGWSPSYPRLMTNEQLGVALTRASSLKGARFTNIGDISCDIEGGLEFLSQATTLSSPFYKICPPSLPASLPAVQMMAVDILPTSIPLDASETFSKSLIPYLIAAIKNEEQSTWDAEPKSPMGEALKRATIAEHGVLTEEHKWLMPGVNLFRGQSQVTAAEEWEEDTVDLKEDVVQESNGSNIGEFPLSDDGDATPIRSSRKKVLILGSGMVAQPAVDVLATRPDVDLVIASDSLRELQSVVGHHLHVKYQIMNIAEPRTYHHLIEESDVVISLLPATMHASIAKTCLRYMTPLVTASYISPEMQNLDKEARRKGVLLLNEIGLDPGIDHCSAMDLITRIKKDGKAITSFTSFCGGLPAPEDSYVPLRYKFSWRPLGVLSAALNDAKYLLRGKEEYVPAEKLLSSYFPKLPVTRDFELEGLPNRDSLSYIHKYGLIGSKTLLTFVRGTLRYPGFSTLLGAFQKIGFLNDKDKILLDNWESFFPMSLAIAFETRYEALPSLASFITKEELQPLQDALEWLGLVRSPVIVGNKPTYMPPLPRDSQTPIEIFAYLLAQKLKYAPYERDMVVLTHEILTADNIGSHWDTRYTSSLITYGTKEPHVGFQGERPASAMARTVGIPVALAALLVVDGQITRVGVQRPTWPDIYRPILDRLSQVGLEMVEKVESRGVIEDILRSGTLTMEGALSSARRHRYDATRPVRADPDVHDLDDDPHWMEKEVQP
ncbi:hypothetical protein BDN70DRAFT_876255 [Pholiota conissans]|uniref:Alanine dehydrogenase/pyridine nucleotide transhydrogenase N-terminal domain-containing protein n=1 Tax=Pholiota conissans TaxID=109636 RepID=A0A9P6D2I7_9AGAR|nr:hypothetical protein BDN70DRAFT_876255 [Pholiota conissans]